MEETKAPLLEKVTVYYYDGCPGCRTSKRVAAKPGLPYAEFIYVWIVTLCTALPISSLFPFVYFMIRDLHIAKKVEDIGFYAGFVGASFMFGRFLTSLFWGIIADKYGRKPVIVFGVISVVIFNTLFGLSTSFWMAIITRFLLGALNGLLGPIRAYASEVCRPEHQAIGVSLVSTSWAIGLVVGPAIGGYFAQPAVNYPNLFSNESIFGRFPYFLPCLIISVFAAVVSFTCIWLPETLHKHKDNIKRNGRRDASETSEQVEKTTSPSEESLLRNWPLMSSIIVYCVVALYDMAFTEVFPLWAESDRKYGGLKYSTQEVGVVLAISGGSLLFFQLLLFPTLNRVFGPIILARIGALMTIPLLFSFPFMTKLSGFELSLVLNIASILRNVLGVVMITSMFLMQNNAVHQYQRGAASGLSVASQSLFKAIAPASAGALFSWAQKRTNVSFLPGDHMVFFFLSIIIFVALLMMFKPFLVPPRQNNVSDS